MKFDNFKVCAIVLILLVLLACYVFYNYASKSEKPLTFSALGVVRLCNERSNNNQEFGQCLSDQDTALGEIVTYIHTTKQLTKCKDCIRKYTDSQERTDFVMVSKCLGKAI